MGSRSCIFWVGPNCCHICPYRREADGDLTQKVKAIRSLKKRGQEQGMQW